MTDTAATTPRDGRVIWSEVRALCVGAAQRLIAWRLRIALGFVAFGVLAFFLVPHDADLVEAVFGAAPDRVPLADFFSTWGDYPTGSLMVVGALLAAGLLLRRPYLRRAGIACFLAASIAGSAALTLRTLVGRPRPRSPLADGIYGPSFDHELHSFPSGHSASSFGTACALLPTLPIVGVPALAFDGGVAWSRIHRKYHHPTDVAGGAALGILFGLALGITARANGRR